MAESRNTYLDQVVAQQERLESDLRVKRSAAPAAAMPVQKARVPMPGGLPSPPPMEPMGAAFDGNGAGGGGGGSAVDVRVSGFGRWKTVLVPPNAFVVHTRRGRAEPMHVGLGVSFRYRPATDSFLVVPGAMQTILLNAFCICKELQGLLVQAYVQWIIQDFGTAYKKLDFSDAEDPMRLVNIQLKEQAEAAVKDKVATMSVHEVLSDKQPIIEELTARLRGVAEGEGGSDQGLGLRIVTVQIKEAVVSSARLWENLQKPFRSEQAQLARLAEVASEEVISEREMAAERQRVTRQIEDERELTELRARNAAASFDRDATERVRRSRREQEDARELAALATETALNDLRLQRERHAEEAQMERVRLEHDHELARLRQEEELLLAAARAQAAHDAATLELERDRIRASIANDQSPASIQARLVESLPEIAERLPKPTELRAVTINGTDSTSLSGLVAQLAGLVEGLR
jgi:hypothetical protein